MFILKTSFIIALRPYGWAQSMKLALPFWLFLHDNRGISYTRLLLRQFPPPSYEKGDRL